MVKSSKEDSYVLLKKMHDMEGWYEALSFYCKIFSNLLSYTE